MITSNYSVATSSLAIIEDDNNDDTPIPSQQTRPHCHQLICPLQNRPLTCNQLRLCLAHMINCVITEELMPTPELCTCPPSLCRRYAFTAECILLETFSPPSHSIVHFIGSIIGDDTGDVLEYRHLMKMDKHKKVYGPMVTPIKLSNFSRASEMSAALTHVFSSPSHSFQLTNAPPMDAFAAITDHRRKRNIALGSPLAVIGLTIQETRAHRRPISPRPNYSSIPPSVPLGPSFWASTLPISTSTPP